MTHISVFNYFGVPDTSIQLLKLIWNKLTDVLIDVEICNEPNTLRLIANTMCKIKEVKDKYDSDSDQIGICPDFIQILILQIMHIDSSLSNPLQTAFADIFEKNKNTLVSQVKGIQS